MHTEGQIKKAIKPLVELYGKMSTSDIKKYISEVIEFDEEDKEMSPTRNNECKIIQRIGNIVSHQNEQVKIYDEGFACDKRGSIAYFIPIVGIKDKKRTINSIEIENKIKYSNKHSFKKKSIQKVNWDMVNERKTVLGKEGEEFVYEIEREKVKNIDYTSVDRVIHLSVTEGDGYGYDILSINNEGETIYIEVKTTKMGVDAPFYMSINEKEFFEDNIDNNVFLYRVYDFNEDNKHGKIKIISAKQLMNEYKFDPITFLVMKK